MSQERDREQLQLLAEAIVRIAVKMGIVDGSQPLTGPQVLMLASDIEESVPASGVRSLLTFEEVLSKVKSISPERVDLTRKHWEERGGLISVVTDDLDLEPVTMFRRKLDAKGGNSDGKS